MALDREREVGARHAAAVVGDADQAAAAAVGHDLDPRRAGVERVLDQFLDHARRPLDHLAGGDAVDDGLAELADGHDRNLIRMSQFYRWETGAARAAAAEVAFRTRYPRQRLAPVRDRPIKPWKYPNFVSARGWGVPGFRLRKVD